MGHQLYSKLNGFQRVEWEDTARLSDVLVSGRANVNHEELFAEAFSYRTSIDFDNDLPPLISEFFEKIRSSKKSFFFHTKASTATEWLESFDEENAPDLEDVDFATPYGNVSMRIATDFPPWMKEKIQERLSETFSQDYWKGINDTTAGDINNLLRDGIENGKSIAQMAKEIEDRYGSDDYPRSRGRLIARTESGNALNGARSDAIDGLVDELGMKDVIKKVWLSVLGNTTRDTHARLDGVPASRDGTWFLGGYKCRWPGDVRLPAGERVNCQCTILTQFGMGDDRAEELIAEYELRQASGKAVCC